MEYLVTAAAVLLAWGCAHFGSNILSGSILIAAGILLYRLYYKRSGRLTDPAALFSIAWIGGMGISAWKLSRLQTDWELLTWICLAAAWFSFALGSRLAERHAEQRQTKEPHTGQRHAEARYAGLQQTVRQGGGWRERNWQAAGQQCIEKCAEQYAVPEKTSSDACSRTAGRIFNSMLLLTAVSFACFFFEAWRLRYVPLFISDTPHAYSYFHVSGVHYFTVSCVLVPSCLVLYLEMLKRHIACLHAENAGLSGKALFWKLCALGYGGRMAGALFCTALALLIPILCVSRFQLIFAVLLAVLTKAMLMGTKTARKRVLRAALLFFACMVPVYIGLTVARAHDVAYLNGIFEMKDPRTPIFFTQPYMYIANNFDNLNCLIRDLPQSGHTLGLRMLFPLWALTGLKFLFPGLVSFPLYVTKTELTTVTLFYDAYYDFGVAGVLALGLLLGAVSRMLFDAICHRTGAGQAGKNGKREKKAQDGVAQAVLPALCGRGAALILIYAQLAFYLLFSFFTTWFSNPTTWFYLALSVLFYVYLAGGEKERSV